MWSNKIAGVKITIRDKYEIFFVKYFITKITNTKNNKCFFLQKPIHQKWKDGK